MHNPKAARQLAPNQNKNKTKQKKIPLNFHKLGRKSNPRFKPNNSQRASVKGFGDHFAVWSHVHPRASVPNGLPLPKATSGYSITSVYYHFLYHSILVCVFSAVRSQTLARRTANERLSPEE